MNEYLKLKCWVFSDTYEFAFLMENETNAFVACVCVCTRYVCARGRMHMCVHAGACIRCVRMCVHANAHVRACARACVHRIPAHVHMMNTMMQLSDTHLQWIYIYIYMKTKIHRSIVWSEGGSVLGGGGGARPSRGPPAALGEREAGGRRVKEGRQGPGLRATRSGPEGDTRRVVVRAGWRGPGGWRRQALTAMFSPAPQDGWSPLHRASQGGHLEVVEALLAKGADVEAKENVSIVRAVHARIGVSLCACSVYIGERACVCVRSVA
jgi:hypothetical protein